MHTRYFKWSLNVTEDPLPTADALLSVFLGAAISCILEDVHTSQNSSSPTFTSDERSCWLRCPSRRCYNIASLLSLLVFVTRVIGFRLNMHSREKTLPRCFTDSCPPSGASRWDASAVKLKLEPLATAELTFIKFTLKLGTNSTL